MSGLKTTFRWTYTPPNFFNRKVEYEMNNWNIQLYNGCAQAVVQTPESVTKHPTLRKEIYEEIERQFFAQQLLNYKSYNISYDRLEEENMEGKRSVVIEAETAVCIVSGMSAEFTITDKNGNVTYDSRQEREQKEQAFRDKIVAACRCDTLSKHLLESHRSAVNEPENELVRLYEIRDALAKHYGGEYQARERLNISNRTWKRFGVLCNVEPLKQGRHKGQHIDNLREASAQELREARELAMELLEAHFDLVINENT